MVDSSSQKTSIPWPALLLLLAGLSGSILGVQYDLKSSRPAGVKAEEPVSGTTQTVEALLWQDPFAAIVASKQASGKAESRESTPASKVVAPSSKFAGERTLVLPVMVMGAGYGVEKERRQRSRYAVVSALFAQGYTPVDGQHLGYFETVQVGMAGKERPLKVPYEEYRRTSLEEGKKVERRVFVLWLTDEIFSITPLKNLEKLFTEMSGEWKSKPTIKILGPGGSGTLSAMIEELQSEEANFEWWKKRKPAVQMVSPWSTVDGKKLGAGADKLDGLFLDKAGIVFVRSVKTDSDVCQGLIGELELRQMKPEPFRGGTIVVLSEWDSLYGRSLPQAFRELAEDDENCNLGMEVKERRYLREIDGLGFGGSATAKDNSKTTEISREEMRKAVGSGQHDYIRRLAEELRIFDLSERRKFGGDPIRAVGVLGSDVYDKLLLLRAMRTILPDAVFFTTDLDVALTHPTEARWARNLIVGSSYGLTLEEKYQGKIAPFRDSYQTSLFASALYVLGGLGSNDKRVLPGENAKITPRIFEIGEFKTLDLSPPSLINAWAEEIAVILPESKSEVRLTSQELLSSTFFLILPFLIAVVPIYVLMRYGNIYLDRPDIKNRKEANTYREWWSWLKCGTCFFFVIFMVIILWAGLSGDKQEPVTFLNGTSVWMTQGLRLMAGFLSFWFLVWGMIRLSSNERTLSEEFGLESIYQEVRIAMSLDKSTRKEQEKKNQNKNLNQAKGRAWRRLKSRIARASKNLSNFLMFEPRSPKGDYPNPREGAIAKAENVWRYYLYNTDLIRFRFHRSAWSWAVIYLVVGTSVIWFWYWPYAPVRGWLAQWVDHVCLGISHASILALIYLVAWAARRCSGLTRCIAGRQTSWPKDLYKQFGFVNADKFNDSSGYNPLDEWLTIQFISRRTAVVGNLIIFPFVVFAVQIFARNRLFDAWTWPAPLVFGYVGTALIAVYFAIGLRRSAEEARLCVVRRLDRNQTKLKCMAIKSGDNGNPGYSRELASLLDWVRTEVESNNKGAFSPISHNPILVAILVPFGGVGSLAFIEWAVRLAG